MASGILRRIMACALAVLLVSGCGEPRVSSTNELPYRTWKHPLEDYTSLAHASSPAHAEYLKWEMAHGRLVSSLDRSRLKLCEAHRLAVESFRSIVPLSADPDDPDWGECARAYESLFLSAENDAPSRLLRPKYENLRARVRRVWGAPP